MKTAAKAVAVIAAVLGVLYGILTSNHLKKPPHYVHGTAADIASGVLRADEGYDWDKAKLRLGDAPTCKGWFRLKAEDALTPYRGCVIVASNDYEHCGIWSDESNCVSLQTTTYLMSEPERLGAVIEGIIRPCRYLPSPDEIRSSRLMNDEKKAYLMLAWKEALCDTHPDRFPGKVVLMFGEWGEEKFRIEKPAD